MSDRTTSFVHLADTHPRPKFLARWEKIRHGRGRWIVEFIAEALATFFYTYAGGGSTAGYVLGNILKIPGLSNVFQVGVAYAVGIVFALTICLPTSQGHANPAFTICAVVVGHCKPIRGLRLIVAQILGAYIACLLIYVQYHELIEEAVQALISANSYDETMFSVYGPAGIFGLYAPGKNLGYIFLNEFVCDFVLAVVIFGTIDTTNPFAPPAMVPWIIGFTYAVIIWGYAPVGLAANSARDIGGRIAVLTLWGRKASGGKYAAIAALTNIPATLVGYVFYEFILKDYSRTITPAHREFEAGAKACQNRILEKTVAASVESDDNDSSKDSPLPK